MSIYAFGRGAIESTRQQMYEQRQAGYNERLREIEKEDWKEKEEFKFEMGGRAIKRKDEQRRVKVEQRTAQMLKDAELMGFSEENKRLATSNIERDPDADPFKDITTFDEVYIQTPQGLRSKIAVRRADARDQAAKYHTSNTNYKDTTWSRMIDADAKQGITVGELLTKYRPQVQANGDVIGVPREKVGAVKTEAMKAWHMQRLEEAFSQQAFGAYHEVTKGMFRQKPVIGFDGRPTGQQTLVPVTPEASGYQAQVLSLAGMYWREDFNSTPTEIHNAIRLALKQLPPESIGQFGGDTPAKLPGEKGVPIPRKGKAPTAAASSEEASRGLDHVIANPAAAANVREPNLQRLENEYPELKDKIDQVRQLKRGS